MNLRHSIATSLQSHRALAIVLALFLALGVTYSIATPIFEAGDEVWHYPFVQHLATGHGLPIQDPNVETLWEQEGGQPPLYYALSALATCWIDTRDLPERLWRNPHARIGIPLDFGNKNLIVHTSAENFPWRSTTLAVHLIRLFSILLSTITVALTYLFALEIRSDKTLAACAAAIVAFNPMFLFISASVNNDNLATMLATLSLLLLARLIRRGATTRRFVALGIVVGLGALTKVSLLGLLIVAAVVFAYLLWREKKYGDTETRRHGEAHLVTLSLRHLVTLLKPMVLCAGFVVAIAFWWYVRNWMLYGDFSAFNVWVQIAGGRPTPVTLASLLDEFQGFRISFWGNFGGVNLIAPEWVYLALDAFTALAAIGLLVGLARRVLPRLLALPTLWLALILILLVRWTLLTMASQGRLIFPAIAAVAVLLAYGLAQFQVSGFKFQVSSFGFLLLPFVFLLFTFAVLAPFTIIAPAYAFPARVDVTRVPNPTHITFDHQAELVGYALPQKSVKPGDALPLTIYWRARERLGEDFSVYLRLFDGNGTVVGRWEAFPGGGLYPTRVWQPGEVIEDQYRVPVALDASAPSAGRIEVGLFRRVPLEALTARDPQGNLVTPTIARFKIVGAAPRVEPTVNFEFADRIALVHYDVQESTHPGGWLTVPMYWRALAPITEDYIVFLHLVDREGTLVAQLDEQPRGGAYPTSFWETGEIVRDAHILEIPSDLNACEYSLYGGLYRASDGTRLPLKSGGDRVYLAKVCLSAN